MDQGESFAPDKEPALLPFQEKFHTLHPIVNYGIAGTPGSLEAGHDE
jgi:hypothetical protein